MSKLFGNVPIPDIDLRLPKRVALPRLTPAEERRIKHVIGLPLVYPYPAKIIAELIAGRELYEECGKWKSAETVYKLILFYDEHSQQVLLSYRRSTYGDTYLENWKEKGIGYNDYAYFLILTKEEQDIFLKLCKKWEGSGVSGIIDCNDPKLIEYNKDIDEFNVTISHCMWAENEPYNEKVDLYAFAIMDRDNELQMFVRGTGYRPVWMYQPLKAWFGYTAKKNGARYRIKQNEYIKNSKQTAEWFEKSADVDIDFANSRLLNLWG